MASSVTFRLGCEGGMTLVVKPLNAFFNPSFEDGVDRLSAGFK